MNKRLMSLFLALSLLVSVFLPTGVAAKTEEIYPEDYDALLVTDGLVGWFDAYDPENGTVDLQNGVWESRVGRGIALIETPDEWWASPLGTALRARSASIWAWKICPTAISPWNT